MVPRIIFLPEIFKSETKNIFQPQKIVIKNHNIIKLVNKGSVSKITI